MERPWHISALPGSCFPLIPKLEIFPVSISQSLVDVPELLNLSSLSLSSKVEGGGTGEGKKMLQLLARLGKAFNSLCVIEGFRASNWESRSPTPTSLPTTSSIQKEYSGLDIITLDDTDG